MGVVWHVVRDPLLDIRVTHLVRSEGNDLGRHFFSSVGVGTDLRGLYEVENWLEFFTFRADVLEVEEA